MLEAPVINPPKSNYLATASPTPNDDSDDGYSVGSIWVNVALDIWFACVDATPGAAVWLVMSEATVTGEPNGFPTSDDTYTTISWDDATRTFQIAPVGADFTVYIRGTAYTFAAPLTLVGDGTDFAIAEGLWFFYFSATGVLTASQVRWDFATTAPVAFINWDAANARAIGGVGDERHGLVMDWATHRWAHETIGMRIDPADFGLDGDTTGDGSLDADAEVECAGGRAFDEDLRVLVVDGVGGGRFEQELSPVAQIPVFYRDGASAWRVKLADDFPLVQDPPNTCFYNEYSAPNWQLTNVTNNRYFAVWIGVCNRYANPIIAVLGQRQDVNISNARNNNDYAALDLTGIFTEEFKVTWRLIFQTSTGYGNTPLARLVDILDLRAVSPVPAATPSTVTHNSLTGRATYPAHPLSAIELPIEEVTAGVGAPRALAEADRHKVVTNEGAVAEVYCDLPDADSDNNWSFEFVVREAVGIRVTAAAGDTIRVGNAVTIAAGHVRSTLPGSTIRIVAINDGEWVATQFTGAWEVEVS